MNVLSKPYYGWMKLNFQDEDNEVNFNVSYLSDPVQDLLNLFISIYKDEINYIPTLHFEGEGPDCYISFTYFSTLITITNFNYKEQLVDDNLEPIHKTVILYKDWRDIAKELLMDLSEDNFINEYCTAWYDIECRNEEKEYIKMKIIELQQELQQLINNEKKE